MEKYIDSQFLLSWISSLWRHFIEVVANTNTLLEIGVIIIALLMACLIAQPLKKRFQRILGALENAGYCVFLVNHLLNLRTHSIPNTNSQQFFHLH